jgi:tetratricopeptide (TPR) repeat protein
LPARGEEDGDAASQFAKGQALLAKEDFDGALTAYAAATKADPKNQEYRQEHALLRRIIKLRGDIEMETDAAKFERDALALRAFYYDHELYRLALRLDHKVHAKLATADSAARLAETQLQLDNNADAAALLSRLDESQATGRTRILLGIALARQGRTDQAKLLAAKCANLDDLGPGLLFDLARLRALIGDQDKALALLIRCFELTPPSRLEAFRNYARQCKDLGTLIASAARFDEVMRTQSKIKESSCSSGADCGKCPAKAACGSKSPQRSPSNTPQP